MAPTRVLAGALQRDGFGARVASAGDVNGDGFGDLLVGTPLAELGGLASAGSTSIFHGAQAGVAGVASQILVGGTMGEQFGCSVGGAGDFNGDGYCDLAVGACGAAPMGLADAGAVTIFHGGPMGIASVIVRQLNGTAAGDQFGFSLATGGDFNGDGLGDLVVGAPFADRAFVDEGEASVYYATAAGIPALRNRPLSSGGQSNVHYAFSMANLGDTAGLGFDDLVVGMPRRSDGMLLDAGRAILYRGLPMGFTGAALLFAGVEAGEQFGYSVASRAGQTRIRATSNRLVRSAQACDLALNAATASAPDSVDLEVPATVAAGRCIAHVDHARNRLRTERGRGWLIAAAKAEQR